RFLLPTQRSSRQLVAWHRLMPLVMMGRRDGVRIGHSDAVHVVPPCRMWCGGPSRRASSRSPFRSMSLFAAVRPAKPPNRWGVIAFFPSLGPPTAGRPREEKPLSGKWADSVQHYSVGETDSGSRSTFRPRHAGPGGFLIY